MHCIRIADGLLSQFDLKQIANACENITIYSTPTDSLTIVYVIGESHSRHRSQLYGYWLPTEPHMSKLKEDSSMVVFSNIISPYNYTQMCYPRLLTTFQLGFSEDPSEYPILPAIMKKAGFHTSYFNNQDLIDVKSDFTANMMFTSAKLRAFIDESNDKLFQYDTDFIGSQTISKRTKNFVLIHLFGQHQPFKNYKEQYFTEKDYIPINVYNKAEREIMAKYDNCTREVDKALSRIIGQIQNRTAVLIYVPDHGETVLDSNHEIGRKPQATPDVVKFQYEIPLYIYLSDKYKRKYPTIYAKLHNNMHKPLYNTDISHTIIDLAHIETPALRPEMSLLSDSITRDTRWITSNLDVKYEELLPKIRNVRTYYPQNNVRD